MHNFQVWYLIRYPSSFVPFSYLNANGATDPNSAVGNTGAAILINDIQDTRKMLSSLGVSLPVGNSDAGSYFNNEVLAAVDFGVCRSLNILKAFWLILLFIQVGERSPLVC